MEERLYNLASPKSELKTRRRNLASTSLVFNIDQSRGSIQERRMMSIDVEKKIQKDFGAQDQRLKSPLTGNNDAFTLGLRIEKSHLDKNSKFQGQKHSNLERKLSSRPKSLRSI